MFDNQASTLNGLIETTLDSVDGYEQAAEKATNDRFAQAFQARAQERREVATTLQQEVRRLGENPEDDGTILAGAHRVFLNLRDAVTGSDDEAVVAEVERGEDHIRDKFENALQSDDLDPQARNTVQQAFASVKAGHSQMSALKNQMEAS